MITSSAEKLKYVVKRFFRIFKFTSVSLEFPFVQRPFALLSRISLKNDFSECTGCKKCEAVCPVKAIEVDGMEYSQRIRRPTTSQGIPFEMEVKKFQINYNQCVFCGLCVSECPTGSLSFSKNIVNPEFNNKNLEVDLVRAPRSVKKGQIYS